MLAPSGDSPVFLQRITFHARLRGVQRNEIGEYVAYRLRVAGYRGDGLFSPAALRALYRASGGTPRLINVLAHKALLSVFGEGRQGGIAARSSGAPGYRGCTPLALVLVVIHELVESHVAGSRCPSEGTRSGAPA